MKPTVHIVDVDPLLTEFRCHLRQDTGLVFKPDRDDRHDVKDEFISGKQVDGGIGFVRQKADQGVFRGVFAHRVIACRRGDSFQGFASGFEKTFDVVGGVLMVRRRY